MVASGTGTELNLQFRQFSSFGSLETEYVVEAYVTMHQVILFVEGVMG